MTKRKKIEQIHPVDAHVGARLRERRILLSISQEQLGKYVGLTFQQIQKYEKGLNRISCSKLFEFAKFLKVDIGYFFAGYDNVGPYVIPNLTLNNSGYAAAADSGDDSYNAGNPSENNHGTAKDIDAERIALEKFSNDIETLIGAFASIRNEQTQKHILNLVKSLSKNAKLLEGDESIVE